MKQLIENLSELYQDVEPWNLLVTPTGMKAIDYTDVFPQGDQAEYKGKEDLVKLMEVFDAIA